MSDQVKLLIMIVGSAVAMFLFMVVGVFMGPQQ